MQKVLSYGLGRRLRCKIECTFSADAPQRHTDDIENEMEEKILYYNCLTPIIIWSGLWCLGVQIPFL